MRLRFLSYFCVTVLFLSCDNEPGRQRPAKLTVRFTHVIDGTPLQFDQLMYTNTAGNVYEVNEIQWFVSDLTLIAPDGTEFLLDEGGFAHYIDTDLPDTWAWQLPDDIIPGHYTAVKITFGLKGEKNLPNTFANPPESNMFWPYHLGGDYGGYHYMKLNGFWMNPGLQRTPFNFHIGVGPVYDNDGNVTAFVQNWFETTLPASSFIVRPDEAKEIGIVMNVENWFDTPHMYDHNVYGGKIMNNQEALGKISENGKNVFSFDTTPEQ